jgi:hypothetical protein
MTRTCLASILVGMLACGSNPDNPGVDGGLPGSDGGDRADAGAGGPDARPGDPGGGDAGPGCCDDDTLSTATGCQGVYNPDQVLDYRLTLTDADWNALKADTTNSILFSATLQCGDEAPLAHPVGVRRKRSGGADKPGLKVDLNEYMPGGTFYSLKKLSLENGISEGSSDAEMRDVVSEYLAWRIMNLSGTHSSRAAFARVFVNGELIGVYVNVEQVDKRFLLSRIGDDSGWLYKKSGSPDDGYKTNETVANPYEEDVCFWDNNPCAAPPAAELETYLPAELDIEQMLRFGGVNALIANSDSPLVKDNNFYFYDWAGGGRVYFPWDLDTTMKDSPPIFGGPGATLYTDVLFTHWEDDYDALLTGLLAGPLALAKIQAELDRVLAVAGSALDADPAIGGDTAADAVSTLDDYWSARHAQVAAELEAHAP